MTENTTPTAATEAGTVLAEHEDTCPAAAAAQSAAVVDLAQLRDDLNSLAETIGELREQVSEHVAYLRHVCEPLIRADHRVAEQHRANRTRHHQAVRDPMFRYDERLTTFGQRSAGVTLAQPAEHPVGFRSSDPRLSGVR